MNHEINRTSHIKFLGIILDENLTWNLHINEICNKLKRYFHIFYNIRHLLSKDNIKTKYYALIYSGIKYGISVYGQASNIKLNKVQKLQNQLLKVLSGKKFRFPTDELHDEFELLTVKDISEQEILTFVHNFFSNNLPPVFDGYFETLTSRLNRNTRNGSTLLKIPRQPTNITESSIKIMGAKLWNKLDKALKSTTKAKKFKSKFKMSRIKAYKLKISHKP